MTIKSGYESTNVSSSGAAGFTKSPSGTSASGIKSINKNS